MNISIAEEFLKFKKLFFIDTANNKQSMSHLKNQVYSQNNEVKSLQDKIFALNHEVKGLQDQILILEEKFRTVNERNQDNSIEEWLKNLEKSGYGKLIEDGGDN